MKKKINILFVCKHNVFRSRVAEVYFKKINKNKKITADSAGFIEADKLTKVEKGIVKRQRRIARKFGIEIKKNSKTLKISTLSKQDFIIIVANDVPNIFNNKFYLKPNLKVIVWKIPDIKQKKNEDKLILKDIKEIIKKVDSLNKELMEPK